MSSQINLLHHLDLVYIKKVRLSSQTSALRNYSTNHKFLLTKTFKSLCHLTTKNSYLILLSRNPALRMSA